MRARGPAPLALPPEGMAALESEGGDWVVLSVPLPAGSARSLTRAESAVVELLLTGLSNAEIATRRGSAERTVANQVATIFRKLGVRSRAELAALGPWLAATPGGKR